MAVSLLAVFRNLGGGDFKTKSHHLFYSVLYIDVSFLGVHTYLFLKWQEIIFSYLYL